MGFLFVVIVVVFILIVGTGYFYLNFISQENEEVILSNSNIVEGTQNVDREEFERAVDLFMLGDDSLLEELLEPNDKNNIILQRELDRRKLIILDEFDSNQDLYYEYLEEKHNWRETHPEDYEND